MMLARGTFVPVMLAACAVYAQAPKFDVAAIKPSAPGGTANGPKGFPIQMGCAPPFGSQPGPLQYVLYNCTLRDLVRRAWSLDHSFDYVIPAEPAWMSSVRYDIAAKSNTPVNVLQHDRMLQALLEERFKLKWHREKREGPVYYLSLAKNAKGGLKLPPTAPGSCTPWDKKGPPPPPYPDKPPTCDYILMPGTQDGSGMGMDGTGVPMASFASRLTDLLGRPVVNQTGYTGVFNLHIRFARDSAITLGGPRENPGQPTEPSGLPNIFTLIRSLGLSIESGKGPIDVFIADSAQKPPEN